MAAPKSQDRVRATILEAAGRVFARKGFSGAKVAEIAHEAGYTAPALYKYFAGGKQQIFEAMLEHALGVVQSTTATLPPVQSGSLDEEVDVLLDATFAMLERHARTFLTLTAIQASGDAMPGRGVAQRELLTLARTRALVGERLRQAGGHDRVGELEPEEAGLFFDALCLGLFLRWAPDKIYGSAGPFRAQLPLARRVFLQGVGSAPAAVSTRKPTRRTSRAAR